MATDDTSNKVDIKKFVSGPFVLANYLKVLVFSVCFCIMGWIGYSSYYTIRGLTTKKAVPTQSIGENSGVVTTLNSSDKNDAKSFQLISVGGCNGTK